MGAITMIPGAKFGMWTVLDGPPGRTYQIQLTWPCRCECGTERMVCGVELRSGRARSCGCLKGERETENQPRAGRGSNG